MLQSSKATFGMGKEKGPEWTEVTILQEPEKAGGNFQVKCGHCELLFWKGATRITTRRCGQVHLVFH